MLPSFMSPVSLFGAYLRRRFTAAGLTSQTITLDDGHGTTIHFWGPKNRLKKKPSLVLIHGFGPVAMFQWHSQVKNFSTKFNLYVPDLLFFGESSTGAADRSEIFQAAAVAALMDRIGAERYSLAGTSYGGIVAYNVAKQWPERVEKIVIASSGVNMRLRDRAQLLKKAGVDNIESLMLPGSSAQMRKLLTLVVHYQPTFLPDFILKDIVKKLYAENRKEKLELLKGLTIGQDDMPKVSPLNQEILLIWGDHDNIFPVEMATELKQLLGKKVRLELIKNTGHVPQSEKPAVFNELVNNFFCEYSKL